MKDALMLHMQGTAEDSAPIPNPRGDASYREALQQSAGETYYMTHIELTSVSSRHQVLPHDSHR